MSEEKRNLSAADLHNIRVRAHMADRLGGLSSDQALEAWGEYERDAVIADGKLPIDVRPPYSLGDYEKMGIKIGPPDVSGLFVSAVLPPGWRILPGEHYMHSYLYDDKGRERIYIHFSPDVHQREAKAFLRSRFSVAVEMKRHLGNGREVLTLRLKDAGQPVHEAGEFTVISHTASINEKGDESHVGAKYLSQYRRTYERVFNFKHGLDDKAGSVVRSVFPQYRNALCYWDDDLGEELAVLRQKLDTLAEKLSGNRILPLVPCENRGLAFLFS